MLYKSQFETTSSESSDLDFLLYMRHKVSEQMGFTIGCDIGFEEISNLENDKTLHRIEVLAISQKQWQNFVCAINAHIVSEESRKVIREMISEIENY